MATANALLIETMNPEEREQLEQFLEKNSLQILTHRLISEGVTMGVLLDIDDAGLKEIGINEFGFRKRLIQAVKPFKEMRGKQFIKCERGILKSFYSMSYSFLLILYLFY